MSMTPEPKVTPSVVDVVGLFDLRQGLRYASDATVAGLLAHGALVRKHVVDGQLREVAVAGAEGPSKINLVHLNPDQFVATRQFPHQDLQYESRLNAIVPFWEVTSTPKSWRNVLQGVDVVVAPTPFVAQIMRDVVPPTCVLEHRVVIPVPQVTANRVRFGIMDTSVAFGFSFGSEAIIPRKNPIAVLDAFRFAFPSDSDVQLVIHVNPTGPSGTTVVRELLQSSANDPRITVLDSSLSYEDVLSFYASLDAYVSLHRAEGLGLPLMESMALGTPVIATGWSGNMGFMSADDSLLVKYQLVKVKGRGIGPYDSYLLETAATWAEPDLSDAVRAMRAFHSNRDFRNQLRGSAKQAYVKAWSRAQAQDLRAELTSLQQERGPGSQGHEARASTLRGLDLKILNPPWRHRARQAMARRLGRRTY